MTGLTAPSGRKPADDGGHNLSSRRAVCDQHKHGSVRGAPREGGAYSMPRDGLREGATTRAEGWVSRAKWWRYLLSGRGPIASDGRRWSLRTWVG
jgi:hypothetical protein